MSRMRSRRHTYWRAAVPPLPNDILLIIFRHYVDAFPPPWIRLAHVCRSWRQIIFTSPLGLGLRLHCTYGTPVLKTLDYWPPFPLAVNYGGLPMLRPPAPEDEDNIMAALEQSDRVYSIRFTLSSSLLKKLSTISKPFSELEELVLLSQDNVQSTLPSAFWWGHRLRTLHSTKIAILSLPQLLLPSQDLVDLQLNEIPGVGYFSPEAFANALCGMTRLESLSLHFLSFPSRPNYLGLPPLSGDRVVLPVLTSFKYRGISKYLDTLLAGIDAPRLGDIAITFFSQPTLDVSQLDLLINRIEMWRAPLQANILSSEGTISITFTQPGALTRLGLEIPCKQLDWQLSSISQICHHLPSFIFSVEDLRIETIGPSSVPDDMDDEQWPRLLRAFDGANDFLVAGKLSKDILGSLRPGDEGHKVEVVFPTLKNLHVQEPMPRYGPLWNSVESFDTQRRLSGHPVQIYDSDNKLFDMQVRKRDEQAENVKTDEQALAFFDTVTKFIDENPGSAEEASNALHEILRTYPSAPEIDDAAMASSLDFRDLPLSPPSLGNDVFGEFLDFSAPNDIPTQDLVTGSTTNPGRESTSDQEFLRAGIWTEISGEDATFHQTPGWKWEGDMDNPDQAWAISTSKAS